MGIIGIFGAGECRGAYGAPNLKSWIIGNLLMTEVVNLEPDLSSLSMFILLKNHQFTNLILFYMLDVAIQTYFTFITYAVNCIKMSTEVVRFAVVKKLISMQECAFRQTIEMFATNMKEDINSIRKTVDDLKCSLNFSQRDIDDNKFKLYKAEKKAFNAYLVQNAV